MNQEERPKDTTTMGERRLLAAVLHQAIHDLGPKNPNVIILDAIRFLEDRYKFRWELTASGIAEYLGCGGAMYRREIDLKIKQAKEVLRKRIEEMEGASNA